MKQKVFTKVILFVFNIYFNSFLYIDADKNKDHFYTKKNCVLIFRLVASPRVIVSAFIFYAAFCRLFNGYAFSQYISFLVRF